MVRSSDGVELAIYDFGGEGADLLLIHPTSFCAAALAPLARSLHPFFHCVAMDCRGHGASGRSARGYAWDVFAEDVLSVVSELELRQPLGFGHSCGGTSLLLAERSAPGTFRSLYCFEPVVLGDGPGRPVHDNPLSDAARRRRRSFASREEAFENFASKPPMSRFDPGALSGYVTGGLHSESDGTVSLACLPEDEAEVYAYAYAHDAHEGLEKVRCQVALGCGTRDGTFGPMRTSEVAQMIPQARAEAFPGLGHFGPLERPVRVAAAVRAALGSQASKTL